MMITRLLKNTVLENTPVGPYHRFLATRAFVSCAQSMRAPYDSLVTLSSGARPDRAGGLGPAWGVDDRKAPANYTYSHVLSDTFARAATIYASFLQPCRPT